MKKGVIKKVLSYIGKYRYFVLLSIVCAAASALLALYIPILVGRAIDCIVGAGNVDFAAMEPYLVKIAVLVAITAIMQWLMNVSNNRITFNVVRDMRNRAFSKIQVLPFGYLDSHPHGETVSRVISDADQFADGLLMGFTQLFTGVVTIIGTLAFMIYINFWIAMVVVVLTPMSFFIARFIAKRTYKMFKLQSETRGEQTSFTDEMITNQKVTQAYGHKEQNQIKFDEINNRLADCSLKATFFSSITNPSTRFVNSVVYAAVALFGAVMAIKGNITVGILSSFLAYATQYTKPFNEISGVVTELQNSIACAGRLLDLIEETEVAPDTKENKVLSDPKGDIKLHNVDFSYVPDKKLIENLNVDVCSGMRVAIVGPTGCGKTTLINLLMKFYDVDAGSISVDGIDYGCINVKSLRSSFGMVLQDTWLYKDTIMENIRYGRLDATDEEVIAAAKAAHVHNFIMQQPGGYDMVLDEETSNISQGQKQRLTIARAILANNKILILDEATSALDNESERWIQKSLEELSKNRTTITIAHRLSTIRDADEIIVITEEGIAERGTHAELLEKNGLYAAYYNM